MPMIDILYPSVLIRWHTAAVIVHSVKGRFLAKSASCTMSVRVKLVSAAQTGLTWHTYLTFNLITGIKSPWSNNWNTPVRMVGVSFLAGCMALAVELCDCSMASKQVVTHCQTSAVSMSAGKATKISSSLI